METESNNVKTPKAITETTGPTNQLRKMGGVVLPNESEIECHSLFKETVMRRRGFEFRDCGFYGIRENKNGNNGLPSLKDCPLAKQLADKPTVTMEEANQSLALFFTNNNK